MAEAAELSDEEWYRLTNPHFDPTPEDHARFSYPLRLSDAKSLDYATRVWGLHHDQVIEWCAERGINFFVWMPVDTTAEITHTLLFEDEHRATEFKLRWL